jgi:hypothetical protein
MEGFETRVYADVGSPLVSTPEAYLRLGEGKTMKKNRREISLD